jgi:hypothetical protein
MPTTTDRKPINAKQLEILDILYRFRFATSTHLTKTLKLTQSSINERLSLLTSQGYIGRRFEPAYRLQGKPASYHLLPPGIAALRGHSSSDYQASELKKMYRDRDAKDTFAEHWLALFDISLQLTSRFGSKARVFTQSQLSRYKYFPRPRPELFLRLSTSEGEKQYFMDLLGANTEPFVARRRVKRFMAYAEEGEWDNATTFQLPAQVLICESDRLKWHLRKYSEYQLAQYMDDDLQIVVASKGEVLSAFEPKS